MNKEQIIKELEEYMEKESKRYKESFPDSWQHFDTGLICMLDQIKLRLK